MRKSVTRKGYIGYIKTYNKKKGTLLKKGISEDKVQEMLSFNEWKETYKATRNTLLEEVKAGTRKQVGNINQYIVSNQAYEFNAKQARAMKIAAEKTGQELSILQIRTGSFKWDDLSEMYNILKEQGMTGKEAKAYNSWYFFGSE